MSGIGGGSPTDATASERSGATKPGQVSFLDQALWKQFSEAPTPETFLQAWLALQCRLIPGVSCGVLVLAETAGGPFAPAAFWPDEESVAPSLNGAAELALAERQGVVQGQEAEAPAAGQHGCAVAYPLVFDGELYGVVAIEAPGRTAGQLRSIMRQLQWGVAWIEAMLRRAKIEDDRRYLESSATAFDLVATALEHKGFKAACNATVTELATRLDCDHVSIGFLRRGHAAVAALSHAPQFGRRMNLIRDIGAAMDEAIDQQSAVIFPAEPEGEYRVTSAHAQLARNHEAGSVLTIPLGEDAGVFGAMTFERRAGAGFDHASIELCDSVAALVGPILREKRYNDRLILWKIADSIWVQLKRLFGPHYLGRKIAVVALAALVAFFAFFRADYRITSPAVLEGLIQRVVVSPFDGYIASESARAGEIVPAGTELATLDDKDLVLERLRWSTTRRQRLTEYDRALAARNRAEISIIKAQIDQAEAQIALLDEQLARVKLLAPFDGIVVAGDLSQSIGASVRRGEELFQIAPLDAYRVILEVDESDIADIAVGQVGSLLLSSLPGEVLDFTVERITPVAEAGDGRNFFRVEARLNDVSERLRPGMEGVAKTTVDERLQIWIWTRKLLDWARLTIWNWWP